ncbi:MAG: DMT family transporter [Desulfobacteraceae bacterium]|nr:DMT family transporter [Desulfobacteraceae bacterium]
MKLSIPPIFYALFCILVWGLSFAVTRSAVQQIPPLTLASLRFFLAAGLLWLFTRQRRINLQAEDRKWIWAMALCGITFYFTFENIGLKLTTASHGSLIVATIPVGTELVVAWREGRWPRPVVWLGTAMALNGVAWVVGRKEAGATITGDLLMFGAVGCWIAYTFLVQRLAGRYPNLMITRWIMLAGAVSLLPAAVLEMLLLPLPQPGPAAWGQVAFLGVVCSAMGYDFWNRAIPALGPTVINSLIYFIPLVGVIGGIVLLDEPVTPALFFGGALIFGGVLLARRN